MDLDSPPPSAGPSTQPTAVQSTRAPVPPIDLFANSDFPPPPGWYREFTTERWSSYKGKEREDSLMEPPKVEWIEEEKGWSAFGVVHQLPTAFPTLQEGRLDSLIPSDTQLTKQQQLHLLLRSFLHTKLLLLDALTKPPRSQEELKAEGMESESQQYIQHMTDLASAMTIISNELRPMQAEMTLELVLRTQLDRRRAQTVAMRERCKELREKCLALQVDSKAVVDVGRDGK